MRTIPKVIENLRETFLVEARKELFEEGYQNFNIRTVAKNCEVAVGTLYNYFSSKELLVAHVILEDWVKSLGEVKKKLEVETELYSGFRTIYGELLCFEKLYHPIFESCSVYSKYFSREQHQKLRKQVEEPIRFICGKTNQRIDSFTAGFLAENLLGASQEHVEYEKLEEIFKRILE